MDTLVDNIRDAIKQRASGQTSTALVCHAPPGHLLAQQVLEAALEAGNLAGRAVTENEIVGATPEMRVVVAVDDPTYDLPYERFAPYQVHEIIALWGPGNQYQTEVEHAAGMEVLQRRLQPLVLVHALEGDGWDNVIQAIGAPVHEMALSNRQAFDLGLKKLANSDFNNYLVSAIEHEIDGMRGSPHEIILAMDHCARSLAQIPPADHEFYQRRMAQLPDKIVQGLGGVAGSGLARQIGDHIHRTVANANTSMRAKLHKRRTNS